MHDTKTPRRPRRIGCRGRKAANASRRRVSASGRTSCTINRTSPARPSNNDSPPPPPRGYSNPMKESAPSEALQLSALPPFRVDLLVEREQIPA